ncbi:MAG: thioredoxin family protein [Ferruginibacter sp.]
MKKLLYAVATIAFIATMAFKPVEPLPIGSKMPKAALKMLSVSGKEISMQDAMKAKGVLVMFSCNTCPYVVKNQERTKAIAAYAEKNKVGIILLNSNEAQRSDDDAYTQMKKYAVTQKYNWDYVVDKNSEVANAFGANRTPECFLLDKNAVLVYHGAIDDSPADPSAITRQHLKEAINQMAAGKAVTVTQSKSVGCGIKRVD